MSLSLIELLRLCLVAVKRFPEKENISLCLVAFQKIFRKIFSGVWKRKRKTQTQEKYHLRSRSRRHDLAINGASSRQRDLVPSITIWDRDLRRELATARDRAIDRDLRHELTTARDRAIDRDLREIAPPRAWTGDWRRLKLGLEIGAAWRSTDCSVSSPLSRVRALSLSLSFSGNALKWKWGEKIISGSKVKIWPKWVNNYKKETI